MRSAGKSTPYAKGDLDWLHELKPYGPIEWLRVSRRLAFERGDALVLGIVFAPAIDGPAHALAAMIGMGRKVADVAEAIDGPASLRPVPRPSSTAEDVV